LALGATLTVGAVTSLSAGAAAGTAIGHQGQKDNPDNVRCDGSDDTPGGNCSDKKTVKRSCLTPDGTDLNQLFGVKERIIGPPACREAFAGERWVQAAPSWVTAASASEAVYPEGYTPAKPNPIDDFNSKFVRARYVHDIGTPQEKTFTFGPREVLRTGFVGPDGLPFTGFVSPVFKPLGVGQHTSTVFFTLSAEHCDGLGTNRAENCLPAGEFLYAEVPFEVVQRHH
jgi:hypothetical protein